MKSPKYILKRLKKKFDTGKKYQSEGFPDLNYLVGNTSGMDVAPNVPSPMDERIGSLAQRGGSVMELIISNPATFQIDKDRMLDTISGLDIHISLHSDPAIGFASAYKTGGQQGSGYESVHKYFTRYMAQFAEFKKEAESKEEDPLFDIGRINPHISTSPMPSLEERMPMDVGLDPFGFSISDLEDESLRNRNSKGQNIFDNEEFLQRLYRTFFLDEVANEYQFYNLFARFSEKFDQKWKDARNDACNAYWEKFIGRQYTEDPKRRSKILSDKVHLLETAQRTDRGIDTEWLKIIRDAELDEEVEITIAPDGGESNSITSDKLVEVLDSFPEDIQVQRLGALGQTVLQISEEDLLGETVVSGPNGGEITLDITSDTHSEKELTKLLEKSVEAAADKLWKGNGEDRISVEGKIGALNSHLDIQQQQITEVAYNRNEDSLKDHAEKVFMYQEDYFENERAESMNADTGEEAHLEMLRILMQNFEQASWMESNLFYKILPSWMSVSNKVENDKHNGWDAPRFIWNAIVERRWSEKYDLDLTDPDQDNGYFDALENDIQFQMDVCAASAACYVWSHFTQYQSSFSQQKDYRVPGDNQKTFRWIDFMNEQGIGVNLEAMPGDSKNPLKIWRPKDIVVAAHAINMTAEKYFEETNTEWHDDLDGSIAKFTLDMEHTATFGVDPWEEMALLVEQEKDLAENDYGIDIDTKKPLARVMRMWHLMRPGLETRQSETLHGPWDRGDTQLYEWLYKMVEAGFARNPGEEAYIMYEVGGDDRGTVYTAKIAMNMVELGIAPDELDPSNVDPGADYRNEKEALIARFYGMDKNSYDREWAKIEEHAFDPLQGLLEAEQFDYTYSSSAAIQNDNRPGEWQGEEYQ